MMAKSTLSDRAVKFGGVARLYGREALEGFARATVCVVGVGGVGSWIVEALARSGVGRLVVVDPDDVCVTNVNRQIHALEAVIGRPKVDALAERIAQIDPGISVERMQVFVGEKNAADVLDGGLSCVVDAVDRVAAKCAILARSREIGLPAVTIGGAGGRLDASKIRSGDLAEAWGDNLLRLVRKKLRRDFGFPSGERARFGIRCVFSHEPQRYPWSDGRVCSVPEPGVGRALDCASGFGTACHVTATFGMIAAGEVLAILRGSASPRC